MTKNLSVYFDFLRFSAAIVVLLSHWNRFLPNISLPFPGKDAVIVFFVLSGFVVAYVADTREDDWREFAISRYSRIISVLLPALILGVFLTPVEGTAGWHSWREIGNAAGPSALNAFFLGQLWFLNVTPPNNNPAWSLNYEAWYYLLFGLAVFTRGYWRLAVLGLAAAAIGPKVLLLLPPWALGCFIYFYRDRLTLSKARSNSLFFLSAILYAAYYLTNSNYEIRDILRQHFSYLMDHLQWSNRFAGDYVLSLIIAMNFIAARHMDNWLTAILIRWQKQVRICAGYTLSIYLYHMPLMAIFAYLFGGEPVGHWQAVTIAVGLIPAIYILGRMTEWQRASVKSLLRYWLLSSRGAAVPAAPR